MGDVCLTTADNPYDPFTQFREWYAFDSEKGYHTAEYVARIARMSNGISDEDNERAVEDAIDEIIAFNLTRNYRKVIRTA